MTYRTSLALALLAAATTGIGGALQHANGPGAQPGLAIVHLGAAIFVCALIAAATTWLTQDRTRHEEAAQRSYVTATDGHTTIPMLGPYETEHAAYADLPRSRTQLDPEGRYEWTVETITGDTIVNGVANDHVVPQHS